MSEIEELLAAEIRALRARIEHLESLEYIAGADAVDNLHAAAAVTANKLLALDANARFPSHGVTGLFYTTTELRRDTGALYKGDDLQVGNEVNITSTVPFDILKFSAIAGTGSSTVNGIIAGYLDIVFFGQHSGGRGLLCSASYFVTVHVTSTRTMLCNLVPVASYAAIDPTTTPLPALAVTEKAGASNTALYLECTVTHASLTAGNYSGVAWQWRGVRTGINANYLFAVEAQ